MVATGKSIYHQLFHIRLLKILIFFVETTQNKQLSFIIKMYYRISPMENKRRTLRNVKYYTVGELYKDITPIMYGCFHLVQIFHRFDFFPIL